MRGALLALAPAPIGRSVGDRRQRVDDGLAREGTPELSWDGRRLNATWNWTVNAIQPDGANPGGREGIQSSGGATLLGAYVSRQRPR